MADSILTTTKQTLGLIEDYTAFDQELIVHINSVLGTLNQLGIGPEHGFAITDKTSTWDEFLGSDIRYNSVKSYMYLRLRLLFDPPSIGYVLTAMEKQKEELEWRINVTREEIDHPKPPASVRGDHVIVDGSNLDSESVRFSVKAGLPFGRRVRVTDGKNIWDNVDDFEARMQIREEESSTSHLKYDFTPHLVKSFDGNDIVIDWNLTGAQTRDLKFGYFDLVVSDVGATDARAIHVIHGYLSLDSITTTAQGSS